MQTDINSWNFSLEGDLFSEHFLKDRLPDCKEFIESKKISRDLFEEIKELYRKKKDFLKKYDESGLEEFFIKPLLEKLDHIWDVQPPVLSEKGIEYRPDYALFSDNYVLDEAIRERDEDSDRYFELAVGLVEAKKWGEDLDKGKTRNPAVQIKKYLRITQINWGILTNGKKWRLYCKESGFSSNVYLEFDLEKILVNDDFRSFQYFFTILNQKSFHKRKGKSFLDRIYDENIRFARGVEDDLEENVYEALKILSEGFLNFHKNDLEEKDIETIHDNCLILLYRLLFLFYAESKKLIRFEKGTKRYSLLNFTKEIIEEKPVSPQDDYNWRRLKRSFDIVNKGSWKIIKEKGIPPYNGGLFNPDKHKFLEEYSVGDRYLREAIDLLARRKGGEWVDYETLQIRHLGSIYEKLLEYKLKVAGSDLTVDKDKEYEEAKESDNVVVKKNEVYLVTGKGERKASGSYYTPDYIVQYIVENTVGKLIEEKTKEARKQKESEAKAILQMKVLDPAMGSGHFLVAATDYMAEELLEAIHRDVENNLWDKNEKDQAWAKREIVSHCIYGVDLNPLAVELAKLSLWLTTFAEGYPLNFLDHRLKCGNSLIGTEIDKLPYFPGEEQKSNLYTPYIEVLTRQVSELLEVKEETVDDVKKKERLFKKIKKSKAYKRVKTLADARTANFFGVDIGGKDPKSRYMDLVNEAYYGDESKWKRKSSQNWVKKSRNIAKEKHFFHWELEFPEVFFEKDNFKEYPGFDVVAGNPPYVRSVKLKSSNKFNWKYYKERYTTASKKEYDIYLCFTEKGYNLLNRKGEFGYILPNKWFTSKVGSILRRLLIKNLAIREIIDFSDYQIFDDVTTYTCLLFLNKKSTERFKYRKLKTNKEIRNHPKALPLDYRWISGELSFSELNADPWSLKIGPLGEIVRKIEKNQYTLKDVANIFKGMGTSAYSLYVFQKTSKGIISQETGEKLDIEKEVLRDVSKGEDINKFYLRKNKKILFPYKKLDENYTLIQPETFEAKYPKAWSYLNKNKQKLEERENNLMKNKNGWYAYIYPRNLEIQDKDKLIFPAVSNSARFYYDNSSTLIVDSAYGLVSKKKDVKLINGLLNSSLLTIFLQVTGTNLRGGYFTMKTEYLNYFPLPTQPSKDQEKRVINLQKRMQALKNQYYSLNVNIKDYLGNYSEGKSLGDLYYPASDISTTVLTDTKINYKNLKTGRIEFENKNDELILIISVRYKPESNDKYETDRWGYTETELIPAMKFSGGEKELALIREFTKLAVEKGGGFANFRKKATKTKSLIERLEKLTLPKLEDVETGLEKYLEQKEKAERLEEEIQETDNLIDAIVFDLYDLNEEEVITVLDSLDTEEKVKEDILNKFNSISNRGD